MLALHTHGTVRGMPRQLAYKVLTIGEALESNTPAPSVLIDQRAARAEVDPRALEQVGFAGLITAQSRADLPGNMLGLSDIAHDAVIGEGDVVRVRANGKLSVLYRRGANANFFFSTERCNSYCLMCSQPPREIDDAWRVDEILAAVPLVDRSVPQLGITGGEPTLLGSRLASIIQAVRAHLPETRLTILSNGRRFADPALADALAIGDRQVLWAVPLYADTAPRHDYVVQAKGAFEETLNGLYNLAERGASIELRMVVHAQTVGRLVQFSEFVWRSLPFVKHVAFMGLEPMGFAKLNRAELYLDPLEYRDVLTQAAWYLKDRGLPASIYNTPLCVLPKSAWPLARRSISDWKNTYAPECAPCAVRESCGGFFKSAGATWRSRGIHPISMEARS